MKYEKCLTCNQLGKAGGCDGPNLYMMDTAELGQWLNARRKSIPGMTYDRTAAETGVSKTAIYNFLSGSHTDVRLETVRPLIKLYIGNCDDNPCGNVSSSEKAAYEEQIRQLQAGIEWRDDKIKHFTEENDRMRVHVSKTDEEYQKNTKHLNKTINILRWAVSIISGLFLLFLIGTIISLIITA